MEYVRMFASGCADVFAGLRGVFPSTQDCKGPRLSTNRGMDTPCCARCYMIRQRLHLLPSFQGGSGVKVLDASDYYESGVGFFTTNEFAIKYLNLLNERGFIGEDVFSCCMVSTCNSEGDVFVLPGRTALCKANVIGHVEKQLLLWAEMHLSGPITRANIGFTHGGIPIIIPNNDTRKGPQKVIDITRVMQVIAPCLLD